MTYKIKKRSHATEAGMMLIGIFGFAAALGMMSEHSKSEMNVIRQVSPLLLRDSTTRRREIRKPDSERPSNPVKTQNPQTKPKPSVAKREVVVAVIDTGSDLSHPDLKGHGWINRGETGLDANGNDKATNGIDDDGNGYVDDAAGFDFNGGKSKVIDNHGHGTHIAGIIAKIAPNAKIMNLKYFDRGIDGATALRNSLEAMRYAIAMKADIINYSGGGTIANAQELAILREASRKGILVVAAAGNESTNSERQPFYPANYRLPNILSVTAIDDAPGRDEMLSTSNFGVRSVAIAAQGKDVQSTLPGGRYGQMTGTSQATAFATGAAVQLMEGERDRKTSPEEIIERIVTSASSSDVLKGKTRLGSKLSVHRAVRFKNFKNESGGQADRRELVHALESELSDRLPGQVNASLRP